MLAVHLNSQESLPPEPTPHKDFFLSGGRIICDIQEMQIEIGDLRA